MIHDIAPASVHIFPKNDPPSRQHLFHYFNYIRQVAALINSQHALRRIIKHDNNRLYTIIVRPSQAQRQLNNCNFTFKLQF